MKKKLNFSFLPLFSKDISILTQKAILGLGLGLG
jgi:hypothetical protein